MIIKLESSPFDNTSGVIHDFLEKEGRFRVRSAIDKKLKALKPKHIKPAPDKYDSAHEATDEAAAKRERRERERI